MAGRLFIFQNAKLCGMFLRFSKSSCRIVQLQLIVCSYTVRSCVDVWLRLAVLKEDSEIEKLHTVRPRIQALGFYVLSVQVTLTPGLYPDRAYILDTSSIKTCPNRQISVYFAA